LRGFETSSTGTVRSGASWFAGSESDCSRHRSGRQGLVKASSWRRFVHQLNPVSQVPDFRPTGTPGGASSLHLRVVSGRRSSRTR
jgi:hypothetical protein